MKRQLFWSNLAVDDFRSIVDFIAEDNPVAAEHVGRSD